MKQEVRSVGKVSASTPSSGSNYLLYSSVESIKQVFPTGCYLTISIINVMEHVVRMIEYIDWNLSLRLQYRMYLTE